MSQQETPDDSMRRENGGENESNGDSVANKLSEELSNWRRRRHTGSRHRHVDRDAIGGSFKSEPARTIKVRGHETLVIRKAKSTIKPPANPDSTER
jgi:hypothetical protein